ncbi:trace amine-associated receptor 13c-like [Girardinichthys multiradiatus]|uniref:trace amine-associated receptor 13c-like n=1 Tax=Girardinichthys multiradiatus TaxID=208333 RepID=UPI001FAE01E6|nr:trace amine-associated receptor 13c-like [Girardinichthys multiradiatus]
MQTVEEHELCYPHLNSSCRKTMRLPSVSMLIYVTLSSISLLTVIFNLLVVVSVCHFKKLHSPTNILLLSLAVSDCLVGFLIVFQIMLIDGCWYLGDIMCALYLVSDYAITSASIGTMVLISVDRYIAICQPLYYTSKVTAERATIWAIICWISSVLFHSLLLRNNLQKPGRYNSCSGECAVGVDYIGDIFDLLFSFIGPVTVIIILYMRVFVVVVSQARVMQSQVAAISLQGSVRVTAMKSEIKAAVILGIVVVVFLICICPYFCVILIAEDTAVSASSVIFLLYYFNSTLNPLIYALFYPWFRKSLKLIITLQILKPGSCETNII